MYSIAVVNNVGIIELELLINQGREHLVAALLQHVRRKESEDDLTWIIFQNPKLVILPSYYKTWEYSGFFFF